MWCDEGWKKEMRGPGGEFRPGEGRSGGDWGALENATDPSTLGPPSLAILRKGAV